MSFALCVIIQTVKRNKQQYELPLKIISYEASILFSLYFIEQWNTAEQYTTEIDVIFCTKIFNKTVDVKCIRNKEEFSHYTILCCQFYT